MKATVARMITMAAGVLVLACCQLVPASSPDRPDVAGEFVRYSDGIEVPSPLTQGMDRTPRHLMLVPVGDCVLGIDNSDLAIEPNGQQISASTNWVGAPGCTRLVLSPRPSAARDPRPSGALRVHAAVATRDGTVLGIGSYPASLGDGALREAPALLRRDPDGSIRELARLPLLGVHYPNPDSPDIWPGTWAWGLARMGQTVFVAGSDVVDGQISPVIWRSTDGGATLTVLRLPPAPTDQPLTGYAVNPIGGVRAVTRAHGRWWVFGSTGTVALSSPDGAQWRFEDSSGMGPGSVTGVTLDHRGDLVVLGELGGIWRGSGKGRRADVCGVVWSGRLGALRRQELGCIDARVKISAFSSIATIADGRVLIANGSDLWIRD